MSRKRFGKDKKALMSTYVTTTVTKSKLSFLVLVLPGILYLAFKPGKPLLAVMAFLDTFIWNPYHSVWLWFGILNTNNEFIHQSRCTIKRRQFLMQSMTEEVVL